MSEQATDLMRDAWRLWLAHPARSFLPRDLNDRYVPTWRPT